MIFSPTPIAGAFVIETERSEDERGFFARTFCREEFLRHGLDPCVAQCGISFSPRRGTLRGMHLQAPPHSEAKLVRCTRGAVYDVLLDLRGASPTFGQWSAVELSPAAGRLVYIPEGVAHGFQTLDPDTEVSYQMSRPFVSEAATGMRWDDPAFGIEWPLEVTAISDDDRGRPDFATA
ncbi:MAG: dTDP-4-dehydrorhamnose 3,5-epimerase [Thermoleophilaceae bacterium]|nr:dTDP-4-dehydrorhamnose 3,5-epimerase [Thermoleophilaceae bacterium]